mmetsp:Transcript_8832/g.25441  ORF Transcript_8832/g.25441 Transcript_8832/m.25441 type:complete len:108 (-) Transcript_8832:250-573(-)
MSNLETAQAFVDALQSKDFDTAAGFVVDDFQFITPKLQIKSKADWLEKFRSGAGGGDLPTFDALEEGSDGTITRLGHKKIAFKKIKLLQTFGFADDGKIGSITIASV